MATEPAGLCRRGEEEDSGLLLGFFQSLNDVALGEESFWKHDGRLGGVGRIDEIDGDGEEAIAEEKFRDDGVFICPIGFEGDGLGFGEGGGDAI